MRMRIICRSCYIFVNRTQVQDIREKCQQRVKALMQTVTVPARPSVSFCIFMYVNHVPALKCNIFYKVAVELKERVQLDSGF